MRCTRGCQLLLFHVGKEVSRFLVGRKHPVPDRPGSNRSRLYGKTAAHTFKGRRHPAPDWPGGSRLLSGKKVPRSFRQGGSLPPRGRTCRVESGPQWVDRSRRCFFGGRLLGGNGQTQRGRWGGVRHRPGAANGGSKPNIFELKRLRKKSYFAVLLCSVFQE